VGSWRGPRTGNDPLLTNHHWRKVIRPHWQRLRLPCARCGGPIDYDGARYLVVNGKHRLNPRYLVVGHKVDRYLARRMGWTDLQINALSNTQPECQTCSNRSGAQLGQRVQKSSRVAGSVITRRSL
jgi:hypothetical protein